MKPLCIDLFCGLGGWTDGFLAEGWQCIGFDITRHDYGKGGYPGQLALQDIMTLHGSQFRNADCIVASPPCQEFSYMAMPWSRAKQIAAALRNEGPFPIGYTGSVTVDQLRALFDACFRIQREACEAAGRYIPMVVENVKGAQSWVGPAKANFGSFYLWGDVESVGGRIIAGRPQFGLSVQAARRSGKKVDGFNFHQFEKTGRPGGSFQTAAVAGIKAPGNDKFKLTGAPCGKLTDRRYPSLPAEGTKQTGLSGAAWFNEGAASLSSKSKSRAAASAEIAKIPLPLSRHIAKCFRPNQERVA